MNATRKQDFSENSSDFFKEVKENLSLVQYVSTLNCQQSSQDSTKYNPCPICRHNDCFTVYPATNTFYCYSCRSGGDVVSLCAKINSSKNFDAAKKLVQDFSLSICLPEKKEFKEDNSYTAISIWNNAKPVTPEQAKSILQARSFPESLVNVACEKILKTCKINRYQEQDWLIIPQTQGNEISGINRILIDEHCHEKRDLGHKGLTFLENRGPQEIIIVESFFNGLALFSIGYSALIIYGSSLPDFATHRKGKKIIWLDSDKAKEQTKACKEFDLVGVWWEQEKKKGYDVNDLLRDTQENFVLMVGGYLEKAGKPEPEPEIENAKPAEPEAETEPEPEKPETTADFELDYSRIHPFFKKFVDEYIVDKTEANPDFVAVSLLTAFGATIGNKAKLRTGKGIYPNLYTCLIAPSTFLRKTTAIAYATEALRKISNRKKSVYIEKLKTKKEDEETPKDTGNILPDDFSPEALLEKLEDKPDGLIIVPEIATLLSRMESSYGTGLKEMLTTLYDTPEEYSKTLKGKSVSIKNPAPSILAASTLQWLQNRLKDSDLLSGFLGRFLWVYKHDYPKKPIAIPGWFSISDFWIDLFKFLDERSSGDFELSQDAKDYYCDWYAITREQILNSDPLLHSFAGRLLNAVHKFALINRCLSNYNKPIPFRQIEKEDYIQAMDWYNFLFNNFQACYRDLTAQTNLTEGKILGVIRERGKRKKNPNGKTVIECSSSLVMRFANIELKELNKAIESLKTKDYLIERVGQKGKRAFRHFIISQ